MREFKYQLPGSGVARFTIDARLIEEPAETLAALLHEGHEEREKAHAAIVQEFMQRFTDRHGIAIEITPEAVAKLVARAEAENAHMRDLCERLFKDYEFGLKLMHQGDSEEPFVITAEAIDDPDRHLSDWLVRSYRVQKE